MKVFLLAPHEDWICDRFVSEWNEHNPEISTTNPYDADIIWLLADWAWDQVPLDLLKKKLVITSIHHIVPEKFGFNEQVNFRNRDAITDLYHVPCGHTEKQVRDIQQQLGLEKPIITRPFWVNEKLWKASGDVDALLKKYTGEEPHQSLWIGSFQRDTEGSDLKSPKLEKGPDLFCDAVIALHKVSPAVKVVLAGWRRQYVMKRLTDAGVPYIYFERPSIQTVVELYQFLWLYIVAARQEGGPQAIVECAAMNVPIISTDVGLAPEIIHPDCIFVPGSFQSLENAINNTCPTGILYAKNKVSQHFHASSFPFFISMLNDLMVSK